MLALRFVCLALGLSFAACNAPEPPGSTGGTNVAGGPCGRGVVVVSTDYQSTNVSLLGLDGRVLSPSFISSATTGAQLSSQLSGDVVAPTARATRDEIVLVDRYPASVLTWVRVSDAAVTRQLSVRTGYAANPHDFIAPSDGRAYVPRYEPNLAAGNEPFDAGDDVLIVDPTEPAVIGRIDVSPAMAGEDEKFFARPSRGVLIGGKAVVLLEGYTLYFDQSAPSRLVLIDPQSDTITQVLVLSGMHGCAGLAPSPDEKSLAVVCSGEFGGGDPDPKSSGVVVIDVADALTERTRIDAGTLGGAPLGQAVAWVSADRLLVTSFGAEAPPRPDRVLEVSIGARSVRTVLEGTAFTLGDVRCAAACDVCFVADAGDGVVRRFDVGADGALGDGVAIAIGDAIGLPPRQLGAF